MRQHFPLQSAFVLLLLALGGIANAQVSPDLATQQLQLQRQREQAQDQQAAGQVPAVRLARPGGDPSVYPGAETPCFPIANIELGGEDASQFSWALRAADDARGRCLGSAGISAVIGRVQNALVGAGFVTTRVLAPPQDLLTGTLALVVVPGRIRAIRFAEPVPQGAAFRHAVPARPGDILNLRDIEQALENFKRVPTAEADIEIVPAERAGQSDLVIQWKQSTPIRFSLSADDGGSQATGQYQASATVSLDNPMGWHDLFYASINHDIPRGGPDGEHGTRGYALHYSLPLGYWLASLSGNDYRYRQSIAGANQDYVYSGSSLNLEMKLARVVYRDAARKSTLALRLYQRRSRNFIDDTEVEVQRRQMSGLELALQHKEYLGPATLDASLAYRHGIGALGTRPAPEEAFGDGTARPAIVSADLNLAWPFKLGAASLAYTGSLRGQWNRTPLVPQDRFAIGGRYTVRGFDGESSLSAERGWLLRNELGWTPGGSRQQWYAGLDMAAVAGPSTEYLVGTRLAGAVLGWRGQFHQLQYDLFAGKPVRKPARFRSAATTSGFNLSVQF